MTPEAESRFDELVARYLDGALDQDAREELMRTLRSGPGARRRFLDACTTAQRCAEVGASQPAVAAVPGGAGEAHRGRWRRAAVAAGSAAAAAACVWVGGWSPTGASDRIEATAPAAASPPVVAPPQPRVPAVSLLDASAIELTALIGGAEASDWEIGLPAVVGGASAVGDLAWLDGISLVSTPVSEASALDLQL